MLVHDMNFLKNEHGCERNFTGWFSGELGWDMGQQIISDEDHDCFEKLTDQFSSEGSLIFLSTLR